MAQNFSHIKPRYDVLVKKAALFIKDESGATAIEYGLIASLISVSLITAASSLGGDLKDKFNTVAKAINGPPAEFPVTNGA